MRGHQEGRFFHGYYDTYCCLPLYIFCGRHLLAAKLRPSTIRYFIDGDVILIFRVRHAPASEEP